MGKNKSTAKAFVVSVIVHAALLLSILATKDLNESSKDASDGNSQIDGGGGRQSPNDKIADKPIDVTLSDKAAKEQPDRGSLPVQETANNDKKDCERWFGGIGITYNWGTGEITDVHKGYPAEKAGIVPGDKLVDPDDKVLGEPGTMIVVHVIKKDGTVRMYKVVREKICLE